MEPKRGWYSRGYLPHLDVSGTQFLTWRLGDSLPSEIVQRLKLELAELTEVEYRREFARRVEAYCDAGHGHCWLAEPRIARIAQEALFANDGVGYFLRTWVVMPNHVHVVIDLPPDVSLADVVQRLKGRSARDINLALGRQGALWQRDYYDRRIRDAEHLERVCRYVEWNPVKAKLVTDPALWEFSSANGDSQKRLEFIRGLKPPGHAD